MGKYAILSDIHGNLQALQEVHRDLEQFQISGVLLLGDLIDYGMQSNEVVEYIKDKFHYNIICNIWGNHERAIMLSEFCGFSSQRGIDSAKRTASILSEKTRSYLKSELVHEGILEFKLDKVKCLAVHGSMENYYWKSILPENVHGDYSVYDVVFSGHSHYPHMFTRFYEADSPEMRNKHAVIFINPGSVGQPRNHHPEAQYSIFDSDVLSVNMRSVSYDVKKAMSFFGNHLDCFYRDRLKIGV